jgi:hypothetical protein
MKREDFTVGNTEHLHKHIFAAHLPYSTALQCHNSPYSIALVTFRLPKASEYVF